jgi:hypothetical protein
MKIHYVTIDGKVRISNANINQRLIEMPDGNHTYPNDGVWQDSERRKDSMIMILQGVRGPYGSNTTGTDIPSVLYEMELAEITMKPQSISKMWHRWFANGVAWITTNGIYLGLVALILGSIAQALLGGSV